MFLRSPKTEEMINRHRQELVDLRHKQKEELLGLRYSTIQWYQAPLIQLILTIFVLGAFGIFVMIYTLINK